MNNLFERQLTAKWKNEVPGARWLKADLHVHTIDDHAGDSVRMPDGLWGDPSEPSVRSAYARSLLKGAVANSITVLGLTPHSPRAGADPETSVVWQIVNTWNSERDDDDIPFRDKIFAVFPGFEPSLKDGSSGMHLLFLFDPEIGRDRYLKIFDLIMGGVPPWRDGRLQVSSRTAEDVFTELRVFHERQSLSDSQGGGPWKYLVLAPHADSPKGLLKAKKAQVLQHFNHREVAGLELERSKLPADVLKGRSWMENGMKKHRQSFFHSSDAYSVEDIGSRYTWLKMADPRIEALRQAFIASDLRIRMGYIRDSHGELVENPEPPDIAANSRPWLKSVTVRGGASFFGGSDCGTERETRFDLNPDLACVIGGSMSGKSTFLDGLRLHFGAPVPDTDPIASQVRERGRNGFLSGSPEVRIDAPGSDPTAALDERWPALFFAQNELQRLAESDSIEGLLAKLDASGTAEMESRDTSIRELDSLIEDAVGNLTRLDGSLAEAEQGCERARRAKDELNAFKDAGVESLHSAGRSRQSWEAAGKEIASLVPMIEDVKGSVGSIAPVEIDDSLAAMLSNAGFDATKLDMNRVLTGVVAYMQSATDELVELVEFSRAVVKLLGDNESVVRTNVEKALVKAGLDSGKIKEFQRLSSAAALLSSYELELDRWRARVEEAEDRLLQIYFHFMGRETNCARNTFHTCRGRRIAPQRLCRIEAVSSQQCAAAVNFQS